jgi:exosome complex component RRP41
MISPEGLRVDGRRSNELRIFKSKISTLDADGSAYVEHGNTKLIASVHGPMQSKMELQVIVTSCTFIRNDRLKELANIIRESFEPIITNHSLIQLNVQILQMDGGVLHAAINASCLALIDAGIPMSDYLVACSAGFANNTPLLDLNYIEESGESPILTIAMLPKSEKITTVSVYFSKIAGEQVACGFYRNRHGPCQARLLNFVCNFR